MVLRDVRMPRRTAFPTGIVIHHTATGTVETIASIDAMHTRRGFAVTDADGTVYHIGYHFLIQQDGTVQTGRPEHLHGAHAHGHPDTLGIALVGNFHAASNRGRQGPLTPPNAQLRAAEALTATLLRKYRLSTRTVYLHRDLVQTQCPGDHFPRARFYQELSTLMR
jgi:N-acetyl-anhydromuramyl-L-alanine amidase AmpD